MATALLASGLIALAMLGLGLGVLLGRAPLRGSCGGAPCNKAISCTVCKARHPRKDRS